jgi:FkbM family methyltransferase
MIPMKTGKQKMTRILLGIRPAFLASALKALFFLRRAVEETKYGKFFVDPVSLFGQDLISNGVYEPETIDFLKRYLRPGGTFVDVGANEGYFSVIASGLVGEKGKAVAIEPQERLQKIISKNIELNGRENIIVLPVAIGGKKGEADLYISPGTNSGSSSFLKSTVYPLPKQKVSVLTLEDALKNEGVYGCDAIKIDVEGWEYDVIMGSRDFFKNRLAKAICLEFHGPVLKKRGFSEKIISDFLFDCGYGRVEFPGVSVFVARP